MSAVTAVFMVFCFDISFAYKKSLVEWSEATSKRIKNAYGSNLSSFMHVQDRQAQAGSLFFTGKQGFVSHAVYTIQWGKKARILCNTFLNRMLGSLQD